MKFMYMYIVYKWLDFKHYLLFIVDISLVQDAEVGDGTTSVTVLACELLKVWFSWCGHIIKACMGLTSSVVVYQWGFTHFPFGLYVW